MAKYLLLKHYRGDPKPHPELARRWTSGRPRRSTPTSRSWTTWPTPCASGASSSTPRRSHRRAPSCASTARASAPVTDGPFAETKDLIAGWMCIDVDSVERAHEAAAFLSSAPGPGGEPIHEWIEVRPFLEERPGTTD